MIDINFNINGRSVRPSEFGSELEKAALAEITKEIERKVGSTRCAQHGQSAKIAASGRSLGQLSFEVSGCCDDLIEQVEKALS